MHVVNSKVGERSRVSWTRFVVSKLSIMFYDICITAIFELPVVV